MGSMVGYKDYFGGTLEGNQCSTLLDNYGILQSLAEKHGRVDMNSYVRVLKALCGIKKACFGSKLDPNFESICDEFRESLVAFNEISNMNVSTKTEFHMLAIHVKQYCKMTGKTFKLITEQALESSHRAWKKHLEKFWVSPNNPMFFYVD